MEQICQELGIPQNSELSTILEHIRTLKKDFRSQVMVASRIPLSTEIEGQGPAITAPIQNTPSVPTTNRSVISV